MLTYMLDSANRLSVEEMPEPVATEQNAIIKVEASSICGTDFRTFMHGGSAKIAPPRILGHENAGIITHAGAFAKAWGLKEGMRVTVAPAIGCGDCWSCSTGHTNMCDTLATIGFQHEGSFAEYMEIPRQAIKMGNVLEIPQGVCYENAVLSEPAACAVNALSYVDVKKGDYVVIYGSGYIGCVLAELSIKAGAKKVIMIEISQARREIAKQMIPQMHMVDPIATDTKTEVKNLTGGRGANVVITALSVAAVHTEALEIASKMGRISLFGGIPGDGKGYLDSNLIHYKELCVYGVHATTPGMMQQVLDMIASGQLDLKKYISNRYSLGDIEKGFVALRDKNAMKVVIRPKTVLFERSKPQMNRDIEQLVSKITAEIYRQLQNNGTAKQSGGLNKLVDHTLLKPDATKQEIANLCKEARDNNFMSVCVNASYVGLCSDLLRGSDVKVCTVVGFPLGATTTKTKVFEAKEAIENGATEIDMVINNGALKSGDWNYVKNDIEHVAIAVQTKGALLKVIIETCLLTDEEKARACEICREVGVDFVKTSTGFSTGGATLEDVALMRKTVGPNIGVKASGGVRDAKAATEMVKAGATRLGTSSGVAIVRGEATTSTY